jgi:hypothetical protein
MASLLTLAGTPLPAAGGISGVFEGESQGGIEVAYTSYLAACRHWRRECLARARMYEKAYARYSFAYRALSRIRRAKNLGAYPSATATSTSVARVSCGRCRMVGELTLLEALAHECSGPARLPIRLLDCNDYAFPDAPRDLREFAPGSHRPPVIVRSVLRLVDEYRASLALDTRLQDLCFGLTDAFFTVRTEALFSANSPRSHRLFGHHSIWHCHRGCTALHGAWSTHRCPHLGGFPGRQPGPQGLQHGLIWDATGITLAAWSY